jgi:hypothetical protein
MPSDAMIYVLSIMKTSSEAGNMKALQCCYY